MPDLEKNQTWQDLFTLFKSQTHTNTPTFIKIHTYTYTHYLQEFVKVGSLSNNVNRKPGYINIFQYLSIASE